MNETIIWTLSTILNRGCRNHSIVKFCIYLEAGEGKMKTGTLREGVISSLWWFTPDILMTGRAVPNSSESTETQAICPMWVTNTQ